MTLVANYRTKSNNSHQDRHRDHTYLVVDLQALRQLVGPIQPALLFDRTSAAANPPR